MTSMSGSAIPDDEPYGLAIPTVALPGRGAMRGHARVAERTHPAVCGRDPVPGP